MPLITQIARLLIPRSVRNALRRPRTTLERLRAKAQHLVGATASAKLAEGCEVKCHPMCVGEFSVFTTVPEQVCEMKIFAQKATPGMNFMDVGAHWGAISLAALHFGGPSARVVAIEASTEAARILSINARLNGLDDRITLVNAACGDRSGTIRMLTTGAGGADYFVVPAEDRPDTIAVRQVSVDDTCRDHNFQPTHLKIDVEGYEEEVLIGAQATLRDLHPVVFLELHGDLIRKRGRNPGASVEILRRAGYRQFLSAEGDPLDDAKIAERGFNIRMMAQ